ncbi:gamma-glutamyltransferase [Gemmatimonas sp.]|jgi:gamma-glutamyltranspeptidase/glutathione hydrolase|uniref:gamma-glutamyltransferase n=1 Tax=Gemmatimonas sp. TaxID=1962908 RepID=UPI0025C11AA4|nr:gamma-glutamyltransferase [Gemmatimonas sp.]MCA2985852.1 gamma-glutamyltransferase [Gemmatimonas sp.]MCA2993879.1 gamma-glutamyltransferase [Gemmatimonas sp.]
MSVIPRLSRTLRGAAFLASFAPGLVATPARAQSAPKPATPAEGAKGMVVSASAIASQVGREVLANGGNAVDAAIATGFALAVTYPTAGNIGGGGFMVIRFPDGRATTIDFRERAPAAATPTMFTDSTGAYSARIHHGSHKAVGVPGTVAGFDLAHQKYGKVSWAKLVEPAARMADTGFIVPTGLAASLGNPRLQERLSAYPATVAAYYRDGKPYAAGDRMKLADLGNTLGRIRDLRRDGFYKGTTAHLIVAEMKKHGGLISEQDLAAYEARERAPVRGTFMGYDIITMPPPSSGGVAMVEMLNILEGFDLKAAGHNSPQYVHLLAESMRRAYRDRAVHLGDPDFTKPPVERLTSKAYANTLRAGIDLSKASPSSPADVSQGYESDETTHYSVVDKDGVAVSVTYTLEAGYGLGAVVEGAGFLLNNEMGDFNGKPGLTDSTGLIGTAPNVAQPGKRMLSSMTPTIVAKNGKLVAVVGSPGGRTIINTVMQVVLNVVAFDMPIQQAVNAPRLHHQWLPNAITVERDGFPASTLDALRAKGHTVRIGSQQGTAHSIAIDPRTGARLGAADPRDRDAGAAGHH